MTKKPDTLASLTAAVVASPAEAQNALATSSRKDVPLKKPNTRTQFTGIRLRPDTVTELKHATIADKISIAARIQALLDIMAEDGDLAARVVERAQRDSL